MEKAGKWRLLVLLLPPWNRNGKGWEMETSSFTFPWNRNGKGWEMETSSFTFYLILFCITLLFQKEVHYFV